MGPKIDDRYKETFETWNKVAGLYEEQFMHLHLYDNSYDFICSSLQKSGSTILDVGCGPGNITKYLLAKRPDFQILGIDIAPKMIELATQNNPAASFKMMDIREIEQLSTTFDGIIGGFSIPYLSGVDSLKFINDCYHLLNSKGLFYLSFVEGEPYKSDFQTASTGDRSYFYYHRVRDLQKTLVDRGFIDLQTYIIEYTRSPTEIENHTIITARKNK